MGDAGAHICDIRRAGQHWLVVEVIDVHPARCQKLWIFLAKNPIAQNAASHVKPPEGT